MHVCDLPTASVQRALIYDLHMCGDHAASMSIREKYIHVSVYVILSLASGSLLPFLVSSPFFSSQTA